MGAWSHEPFGNDDANDWAYELEETEDLSHIEAALAWPAQSIRGWQGRVRRPEGVFRDGYGRPVDKRFPERGRHHLRKSKRGKVGKTPTVPCRRPRGG